MNSSQIYEEEDVLHKLKHFLPAQAPLKDFIHHNTLHAFQELDFFEATRTSAVMFGNKTTLSLTEFRELYRNGQISDAIIERTIMERHAEHDLNDWKAKMHRVEEIEFLEPKVGTLRAKWKSDYRTDLDVLVHPNLFKLISSYLDQGIAIQRFPETGKGLLNGIIEIQQNSMSRFFHSKRVKHLLYKKNKSLKELLAIIVGDERYYVQYLFDQQFAHPGWSGMVATVEERPATLSDKRKISLFDFIYLELLFEIEMLEKHLGKNVKPLVSGANKCEPVELFADVPTTDYWEVISLWQEAFEGMYYDQVLRGIMDCKTQEATDAPKFQAFFCIDDREESIRRHLEVLEPNCATFGTPAHFGIVAMYQPENGKFYTQICPGVLTPRHLIKEGNRTLKNKKDVHFHGQSHNLIGGWIITQTVGFWSAIKLFLAVLKPTVSVAHSSAFEHLDGQATLLLENVNDKVENRLQVGYQPKEMIEIVASVLLSTGLQRDFAPLIYFFGHGASSTNNPYYAGYNCGACSGKPSSVNAKAFCRMANMPKVREGLKNHGIEIPAGTQFIGGLHDTTKDEFVFYREEGLNDANKKLHDQNKQLFEKALEMNAKERARQFLLINIKKNAVSIHKAVKERAYALFEPRPELNHSNNSLCIVGHRNLTKKLFLDQRAFLNSYNCLNDKDGKLLESILNAASPVCGGINLEYFFSRVDNEKLGAGSKLPQNVVGLFGVSNGIKGDLRPGLPSQMIDVHDPLRLLMIIEHYPAVVMNAIMANENTFEWYRNNWIKLAVVHPETREVSVFKDGVFVPYIPVLNELEEIRNLEELFESSSVNLPVYQLN